MGAGALLGPLYGAVLANIVLFYGIGQQDLSGFVPADIGRGIFAIFLMALLGGIAGGIFGLPGGLILGTLGGLAIGVLTRIGLFAAPDGSPHRGRVILFSALYGAGGAFIVFWLILTLYSRTHTIAVVVAAAIAGLPALIAGAIAVLISLKIMQWYQNTTRGAIQNG